MTRAVGLHTLGTAFSAGARWFAFDPAGGSDLHRQVVWGRHTSLVRRGHVTDSLGGDDEYERRFLVDDLSILTGAQDFEVIEQVYPWIESGAAIRLRCIRSDDAGLVPRYRLGMKGPRFKAHRYELEMDLEPGWGSLLLKSNLPRVVKRRYGVISEGNPWVIDVFDEPNRGLVIAEFEASRIAVANMRVPWWAGNEVTEDSRYNNEQLALNHWPFEEGE